MIFFDGGGACWDTVNCIYAKTFSPMVDETALGLAGAKGIFDMSRPANPFRHWNFVFIPYCTGDIHWGSATKSYPGYQGDGPYTIPHRGFDNFLVALKWIKENFQRPNKIFVTGLSAGSYGALLGFPYIQETFPNSVASMLGDAGFGVLTELFHNVQIHNWGFFENLPAWIPGFERPFSEYSIAEMYKMIAEHYPDRKIGQFTNAWDATQAFFYNVMINIADPTKWQNFTPVWCDWNEQMLEHADLAAEAPNYRYYIAAGTAHTIMAHDEFYEETSAGVPFIQWIRGLLINRLGIHGRGGGPWRNLECSDCGAPLTCP